MRPSLATYNGEAAAVADQIGGFRHRHAAHCYRRLAGADVVVEVVSKIARLCVCSNVHHPRSGDGTISPSCPIAAKRQTVSRWTERLKIIRIHIKRRNFLFGSPPETGTE